MKSSLVNNNELNKVLTDTPQMKCLLLQEYQQFHLDLDKARREIASLNEKLCHARRNLEDEKRKRRVVEHHKNLLESQINTVKGILFHNGKAILDEEINEKLQFLNKPMIEIKGNNLHDRDRQNNGHLTTIAETDSTGSILSDLNCLSKSEDDLDSDAIIKVQKQKEWKEYKSSSEYSTNKLYSTLDKVAEFNSPDKITNLKIKPNDNTYIIPSQIQVTSNKESTDFKPLNTEVFANHNFISKIVIKPETCIPCGKRIRFGKIMIKCKVCPITCHAECKTQIFSFPCVGEKSKMCNV